MSVKNSQDNNSPWSFCVTLSKIIFYVTLFQEIWKFTMIYSLLKNLQIQSEKISAFCFRIYIRISLLQLAILVQIYFNAFRRRSRTAAIYQMECFMIIINGWKLLTIITKRSILDDAAVLDLPVSKCTINMINMKTETLTHW